MVFFMKLLRRMIAMNNGFLFGISVAFLAVSSWLAYFLEPKTFESPFIGLWWVMTTVTTVGYGDVYPHSLAGKLLGIGIDLFGIGLISITISKVVDSILIYQRRREQGKLRYSGKGHFVIIGWSKYAEYAIHEIRQTDPGIDIVLIDVLETSPFDDRQVHFVQGSPVQETTLAMANVNEARAVLLFADDMTQFGNTIRDPAFIDGKTLLVAAAIERLYPHVYTVVEIRDKSNLPSFEHIRIDEFIFGSEAISHLAVRSAFHPGTSGILNQIMTNGNGEDLYQIPRQSRWRTYRDAFDELLRCGATLIADGTRMNISHRMNEPLPQDARLFVICSKETYRELQKSGD